MKFYFRLHLLLTPLKKKIIKLYKISLLSDQVICANKLHVQGAVWLKKMQWSIIFNNHLSISVEKKLLKTTSLVTLYPWWSLTQDYEGLKKIIYLS
jgi:hypothetical protein